MVLDEIRREVRERHDAADPDAEEQEEGQSVKREEGVGTGRVLVVVNDERTCYQLKQVAKSSVRSTHACTPSLSASSLMASSCVWVGVACWSSSSVASSLSRTRSSPWEGAGQEWAGPGRGSSWHRGRPRLPPGRERGRTGRGRGGESESVCESRRLTWWFAAGPLRMKTRSVLPLWRSVT